LSTVTSATARAMSLAPFKATDTSALASAGESLMPSSPHHDHVPALGAQLFHVRRFVFGKHLRVVLVDAERAQARDDHAGFGAQGVFDADHAVQE
jgi:hypothetical protein